MRMHSCLPGCSNCAWHGSLMVTSLPWRPEAYRKTARSSSADKLSAVRIAVQHQGRPRRCGALHAFHLSPARGAVRDPPALMLAALAAAHAAMQPQALVHVSKGAPIGALLHVLASFATMQAIRGAGAQVASLLADAAIGLAPCLRSI